MTGWLSEFSDPADRRNVERLRAPDQPLPKIGAFQGFGEAVKDGLMIGGAGVARAGQLAGSTVLLAQDHLWGLDPQADGSAFKQYMDATEPVVESAEDYWKIDSENTGTAGQIAGGLSRIVLPLMAGAGNPALLASSETAITATDALDGGATSNQAVGIGLAQGAAVAVGAKIPVAFGKTLGQKVVTGALANTALGVGVRAVQSGIAGDNEQLSQMYDPFDSTSLAVDLGIGATFGAIAGLAGRRRAAPLEQQDAIAAAEVESSINSSMPDPNARPPQAQAHRTDLDAATRSLEEGQPVQPRTVLPEDSAASAVQPILSPTGNPFLSDVGAEFALESQGLQATHEVREVRGGYAIFPKSDAVPVTPAANSGKVELTENGQSITIQPTGANATPVTSAQSPARAPTQPLSPVKQGIATAAEQAGIDPTTALVIGHIETGGRFNADAQNTASTANGLFQVIQSSWKALGGGNRADPAEQIRVGLLHMKQVEGTLTSALGRPPALHESYMGHLLGAGGARIVLTADPNARLYDVVYGYTKGKTEAQRVKIAQDTVNNNGMRGLTVGEAIAKWQAKTNQVARLYSEQARGGAAFTPAGDRVEFIYDVVEVGDLTTSHNNDLSVNDLFPSELQPRDRDRAASIEQANDYANRLNPELLAESPTVSDGAPIVGMDGVVESGNIRTISRRLANERGLDAEYRQYILDNAERFGMNRADVEAMAVPMLVRRRTTDVDRAQFAKRANDPTVAVMSASERAQSDAMEMPDATLLQTNADGTLNINGSMDYVHAFIQAMPQTERGMMQDADGRLSIDGERRIAAAITRQAYGDGNLVARIAEKRDDNSRTVANALLKHAPTLVQLAGMVAQGARKANTIAADLASAAAKYSDIRAAGQTVDDYFAQQQLIDDGMSDGAREALQFMGENNRSGKAIGEYIQGKIAEVEAAGDPRQPSLFDDTPEQSAAQSALIDNDIEMPTGELDADGNPIMMSGRDALALIEQETAVAQEQTTATQAAVSCALSRGL